MINETLMCSDNYSYTIPTKTDGSFIEELGRKRIKCVGRVIEIEHHELFYSRFHKIINSLFRGEAYQFGHQTIEYTIRVEELTDGYSEQAADFFLYGNYMGRLYPGDEAEIIANDSRGRYIADKIFNQTTQSYITPGLQLSAFWIRLIVFLIIMATTAMVVYLRNYIETNGAFNVACPAFLVVGVYWLIKRKIRRIWRRR